MFEFLVEAQRTIRDLLSSYIAGYAESRDVWQLAGLLPLAIVFGVAHALTPGHSKAVLASYVMGSGVVLRKALAASALLSFVHITSAVILATVASSLITRTIVGAGQAPALELISRVSLALIGVWMILRPLLNRPHVHGEVQGFAFMAGLIPCPLTLLTMMLAVAKGVPAAGIAFAVAMYGGVVAVLSMVAVASLLARKLLLQVLRERQGWFRAGATALELASGLALVAIAIYELR